ncbi:MAG: ferric reductase-like transmembrane domain-containing protein [Acidobacteriaceae bacterium]|nr:ferric reductase-like transmembrane domain-containing protein [Acidobacteriaceae bacterium]
MKLGHIALIATAAVTVLTWALSHPATTISFGFGLAQLFGTLALTALACGAIISTRLPTVTRLIPSYATHKWLGITAFCLVLIHVAIFLLDAWSRANPSKSPLSHIGAGAVMILVVLIPLALLGNKMQRKTWQRFHTLMVIPYAIGLIHYYGCSSFAPFGASPISIWMDVVNLIGIAAMAYAILFAGRTHSPKPTA